jgi:hypothetical protein
LAVEETGNKTFLFLLLGESLSSIGRREKQEMRKDKVLGVSAGIATW